MKKAQKSFKFLRISIPFILVFSLLPFFNLHYLLLRVFVSKPITILLVPTWFLAFLFSFKKEVFGLKVKKETKEEVFFYAIFITFIVFYLAFFSGNLPIIVAQTSTTTTTTTSCGGEGSECSKNADCCSGLLCDGGVCENPNNHPEKFHCEGNWLYYGSQAYTDCLFCCQDSSYCSKYDNGWAACCWDGYYCTSDTDCTSAGYKKCVVYSCGRGKCECDTADDCLPQNNVKGKCDTSKHTCYWEPCTGDSDCVSGTYCYCGACSSGFTSAGCLDGQCCNRGYGGGAPGSCVSSGTISGSYLCDPPEWNFNERDLEIKNESKTEKNVIGSILSFFYYFFQRQISVLLKYCHISYPESFSNPSIADISETPFP
jgi:hypothetical protein